MSSSFPIRDIPVRFIRTNSATQARVAMDQGAIHDYAEAMKDGARFPPVTLFQDADIYWLGDGFHRVEAAQLSGKKNIKAEIRQGGVREAQLFAIGANHAHGLRRSNADKRKAVNIMLDDPEWGEWSNNEISKLAGVSHTFVNTMRTERVETVSTPTQEKPAPESPKEEPTAPSLKTDHGTEISVVHGAGDPEVEAVAQAVIDKMNGSKSPDVEALKRQIARLEEDAEAKDEEIEELHRKLEEAGAQVQELHEENQAMHRILDAEDLLKAFKEEVVRAQALARTTEERFRGIQNQNKALSKSATSWKRKADALERKLKGAPAPEPELEDDLGPLEPVGA